MNLYYIVFVCYAFIFVTSSVHGLRCYKCKGGARANCTEFSVPDHNSVELCDPNLYPDRTPMCRIAAYYKWSGDGEREMTDIIRNGCTYVKGGVKNDCEYTPISNSYGKTVCVCKDSLCNKYMGGRW